MNKSVREVLSYVAYPAMAAYPVVVSYLTLHFWRLPTDPLTGKAAEVALFLTCAIPVVLALIFLEKKMPAQPEHKVSGEDMRTDLTHLAMCWFAVVPLAQQLIRVLALVIAGSYLATTANIWPSDWPIMVQLVLALVIGEFGQYWFHRMAHETELGWRVHATHHGTPQVYWLNSTRFHAFELIIKNVFQVGPLILLGCNREVFLFYGVVTAIHGWIQHSNVAYRTTIFNWVIATPQNHRWHHSLDLSEANSNYGVVVPIWDHLFGTFFRARGRVFQGGIGIADMPDFPKTYFTQFLSPFRWKQLPRASPQAAVAPTAEPAREAV